jgi:hypothetical protein
MASRMQERLPDECTSMVTPSWRRSLGGDIVQLTVPSDSKRVSVSTDTELREALASATAGTWVLLQQSQYVLSSSLEIATPNLTLSTSSSFSVSSWAAIATAPAGERRATLTCGDGVGTAIVVRYAHHRIATSEMPENVYLTSHGCRRSCLSLQAVAAADVVTC